MGIDLPPVTSAEIGSEFQKPLSQEIVSVGFCKSPDFQKQFDELQTQTKEKTAKLQEKMQYSEKQKEILRKIYGSLGNDNHELKSAIENQGVKIFEVPNRDLVAVSIDGKNVDYLYNNDGEIYGNFKEGRKVLYEYIRLLGFSASGNFKEKLLLNGKDFDINNGNYNSNDITFILLGEDGKELKQFSEESLKRYAEWSDYLTRLQKRANEILNEF